MIWPPVTMATQHPDNASAPWWRTDAFIPTQDEIEELRQCAEMPIDECMWDWEGKYVDEAVGEKLFSRAGPLPERLARGDLHLTYRIPAFDGAKMHRMARAFMNVLSLADVASDIGLPRPPVTEFFLPLTESAEQLLKVRDAFRQVADYHRAVFHPGVGERMPIVDLLRVTPLVESVESMFAIRSILEPYWRALLADGGIDPERGARVFLARSDPALNAGLVPAVLAVKAALGASNDLADELGITVHPVIGTGSLPFRGSVNPTYTDTFLEQYAGVRTYSIQSAFRYDYPREQAVEALNTIRAEAPRRTAVRIAAREAQQLQSLSDTFSAIWRPTIEQLAPRINAVAKHVPARRERLLHVGLFGYSRGVGEVRLPRAIGFTAALYSIGIPPELIATGRGLRMAEEQGQLPLLEKYYPALRDDLRHAGKFLNRENMEILMKSDPIFTHVADDVGLIERILGIALGPEKPHHVIHRNLTSSILHRLMSDVPSGDAITADIVEAGILRRSLG